MGRAALFIEDLLYPFHRVEEWVVPIPAGQFIDAQDETFHMLFLLEGEFSLEVPGHPVLRLVKGDAHSMSFAAQRILRSPYSDREMRLHFLRLEFQWPASRLPVYRKSPGGAERRFAVALRRKLGGLRHFPNCLAGERHALVRSILSEMERQNEASVWKISGLCQALAADFLSIGSTATEPPVKFPRRHRPKSAIIKRALQYLRENCHEAHRLDSIAWEMQLSGEYLARLFKQETGRTVFAWLDDFRTEKARDLLIMTELSISQIADACGYSTSKLFIRHFKKNMGFPPVIYRTKVQSGEIFAAQLNRRIAEGEATKRRA